MVLYAKTEHLFYIFILQTEEYSPSHLILSASLTKATIVYCDVTTIKYSLVFNL